MQRVAALFVVLLAICTLLGAVTFFRWLIKVSHVASGDDRDHDH